MSTKYDHMVFLHAAQLISLSVPALAPPVTASPVRRIVYGPRSVLQSGRELTDLTDLTVVTDPMIVFKNHNGRRSRKGLLSLLQKMSVTPGDLFTIPSDVFTDAPFEV